VKVIERVVLGLICLYSAAFPLVFGLWALAATSDNFHNGRLRDSIISAMCCLIGIGAAVGLIGLQFNLERRSQPIRLAVYSLAAIGAIVLTCFGILGFDSSDLKWRVFFGVAAVATVLRIFIVQFKIRNLTQQALGSVEAKS